MLIVPFFGEDVLELSTTLPGVSTGISDSVSVSGHKGSLQEMVIQVSWKKAVQITLIGP